MMQVRVVWREQNEMNTKQLFAGAILAGTVMFGIGCNAAVDSDPTPVTHFKITPASGSQPTATAAAATPASQATSPSSSAVTVSAKNSTLKFDKEKLLVSAGPVTLSFDNADAGIPHNISVFDGPTASGTKLGTTDLEAGPITQTLALNLKPGTYFFQCDVHPTTMKGTITAQ